MCTQVCKTPSLCTDLDECAENDMLCDQICENTFGSYVCTCEPGYELIDDVMCQGQASIVKILCVIYIVVNASRY